MTNTTEATAVFANIGREFPNYPVLDLPVIPAGFEDVSWHNDACPSFLNEKAGLIIFVDYVDQSKREYEGTTRFNVNIWDEGNCDTIANSDDWDVILAAVEKHIVAKEYKETIGYDPFEDDASNTVQHVREILEDYKKEAAAEEAAVAAPVEPEAAAPVSIDIHVKIKLAREFGEQIQFALSVTDFRAVCERNKASDEPMCATHDFCDANEFMLEAFRAIMKRDPDMNDDADLTLWNEAWAIAKAAEFFA